VSRFSTRIRIEQVNKLPTTCYLDILSKGEGNPWFPTQERRGEHEKVPIVDLNQMVSC
jgi:hypothetical protein